MKKLDQIRRVRHLSGIVQAHLKLPLLRIGLRTGLFDELRYLSREIQIVLETEH